MRISSKLNLVNLSLIAATFAVVFILAAEIRSIEDEFNELTQRALQVQDELEDIRFSALRIVSSTSEYLLLISAYERGLNNQFPSFQSFSREERGLVETAVVNLNAAISRYRELVVLFFPDEEEFLQAIESERDALVGQSEFMLSFEPEFYSIGVMLGAKEEFELAERNILRAVDAALEHEVQEYEEKVEGLNRLIGITNQFVWGGLFLVALFVLVLGTLTAYSISNPLRQLATAIESVRKGNFSTALITKSDDEIGDLATLFNEMSRELRRNKEQQREFIEQLEQKNIELERYSYTVSHDLKTPLVTVKGFLGMLERDIQDGDSEKIASDIEYLNDATSTMARLLDDLLELSRVGRVANPSEQVSMNEICDDAMGSLRGLIDDSDLRINVMPDMPDVFVDRSRVGEVVQNLVENAIKFTHSVTNAELQIYAEARNGATIFVFEDNGIGIEEKFRDRVFQLFERLDAKTEGTGVGLSLVKRIIEIHGGEIWIETPANGSGSAFCFTLPPVSR